MTCKECPYNWQDVNAGERYPHCHWVPRCPDDLAPCEIEEVQDVD